jgi:citrate synthase
VALLERDLEAFGSRDPDAAEMVRTYRATQTAVTQRTGRRPAPELPTGLLLHLLGLPVELHTAVVLSARLAGVMAHVAEQRAEREPLRVLAAYEGPTDLPPPEGLAPARC